MGYNVLIFDERVSRARGEYFEKGLKLFLSENYKNDIFHLLEYFLNGAESEPIFLFLATSSLGNKGT